MRFLALCLLATPCAADPIEGLWQTQPGRDGQAGLVRIAACGPALCGTVLDTRHAGLVVLRDIPRAEGTYRGGEVTNPDTGDSYTARLILKGDRLDVGGCILAVCRSGGVWRRVD